MTESFDGFGSGTPLTTEVAGVVFSSPHTTCAGCLPVGAYATAAAVSPPNILGGGSIPGSGSVLQTMVLDFSPSVPAIGFRLAAQDPSAGDVTVRFDLLGGATEIVMINDRDEDEDTGEFWGFVATDPILRVTLISGEEMEGGFEEFGIDDLMFGQADTQPPICNGRSVSDIESGARIDGTATDDREGDTGIASVALAPGSTNLDLFVDEFEPGSPTVSFRLEPIDFETPSRGGAIATDGAGNSCRLGADIRPLPPGPLTDETICQDDGILFSVSNPDSTPPGTSVCNTDTWTPSEPVLPPGYMPSPPDDPFPCLVLTIDSPVAGDTEMVYKKDGTFDPRLRLLFSRSTDGGLTFPPFTDVTESVQAITTVVPDPTRISGTVRWSPVKVACAIQETADCSAIDPALDFDTDGYPLCPAAGSSIPADCNDQIAAIHPDAPERCNGLDDNCDAAIDEGDPGGGDSCTLSDLLGACATGETACFEGGIVCRQTVHPTTEVCDGIDDDCDGATDENHVFGGYRPPVRQDGSSVFSRRRNSTIPFKFQLTDCAGAFVADETPEISLFKVSDAVSGTEIETVDSAGQANSGNLYRYDADAQQYIYNLSTASLSAGTYIVRTTLDDGTTYDVQIAVR